MEWNLFLFRKKLEELIDDMLERTTFAKRYSIESKQKELSPTTYCTESTS